MSERSAVQLRVLHRSTRDLSVKGSHLVDRIHTCLFFYCQACGMSTADAGALFRTYGPRRLSCEGRDLTSSRAHICRSLQILQNGEVAVAQRRAKAGSGHPARSVRMLVHEARATGRMRNRAQQGVAWKQLHADTCVRWPHEDAVPDESALVSLSRLSPPPQLRQKTLRQHSRSVHSSRRHHAASTLHGTARGSRMLSPRRMCGPDGSGPNEVRSLSVTLHGHATRGTSNGPEL